MLLAKCIYGKDQKLNSHLEICTVKFEVGNTDNCKLWLGSYHYVAICNYIIKNTEVF